MKKDLLKKTIGMMTALTMAMSVTISVTGCGSAGAKSSSGVGGTTASAAEGINLKYALTEELNSLDPNLNYSATSMSMISNTNEGLYKYDKDGKISYGLADKADISEDGLTYTFHIRDDAYWSNGDKVTANDFVYSWKRLADPDMGCVYSYMLVTAGVENAQEVISGADGFTTDDLGISAPDESTFVVKLTAAKSYFDSILASGTYFMPVNQKFAEEAGDQFMLDKENSIYCGPFVMTEWEVGGTTYTLSKNPDYYAADDIEVSTINYSLLTDAQQKILAWESGELDSVTLTGDYIAKYKGDESMQVQLLGGLFFIAFNTDNKYLSNQNLRLAISTAINKEPIVDSILCDQSVAADYIIPASFAATSDGTYYRDYAGNPTFNEYDPDKAAEYFEAAKSELGTDTFELEFLYNDDSNLAAIAADIQSELQEKLPGMVITLRSTSYNQRLQDMGNGDYDFGITRWYGDYQDASTFLDMWIDGSGLNYERFHDDEYMELYNKVIGELATKDKEAERLAAQMRMEEIMEEQAIICPLYQPSSVTLVNTEYEYTYNTSGYIIPRYTRKKAE